MDESALWTRPSGNGRSFERRERPGMEGLYAPLLRLFLVQFSWICQSKGRCQECAIELLCARLLTEDSKFALFPTLERSYGQWM